MVLSQERVECPLQVEESKYLRVVFLSEGKNIVGQMDWGYWYFTVKAELVSAFTFGHKLWKGTEITKS